MAIRLYIADQIDDERLRQLLRLPKGVVEAYQAARQLSSTIERVEDQELKQELKYQLYLLKTSIPSVHAFSNYKVFGFGRVDPGLGECPEQYLGGTDSPNKVARLLTQVGRAELIGLVKSVAWS